MEGDNMTTAQVYGTALALPEESRAELAYQLLQSLKPPAVLSDEEPGFSAELERRVEANEAGDTSASDWEQVSARLRQTLKLSGPAK
jgi:putative addiction module component (TIGR02574 family)